MGQGRTRVSDPYANHRLRGALEEFTPGARADLLYALTSPPDVRAARIRLCFERLDTRDLGELLIDLEADDFARAAEPTPPRPQDA